MAGRSTILIWILVFGMLFSMFYYATATSSDRISHDPNVIPTKPKLSQLQALEIAENHLKSGLPKVQDIRLDFQSYNFTIQSHEADPKFTRCIDRNPVLCWSISKAKEHPELLSMSLFFIHSNGQEFSVYPADNTFEKICEEPSFNCHLPPVAANAARDRLVYRVIITLIEPSVPFNEALYLVDAETGDIVWNFIDFMRNRLPAPNFTSGGKTINQLLKELANPPEIANVDIEYGAGDPSSGKGYLPKEVRVTLGIDNKVMWTNRDNVPHSVVSDPSYVDKLTRKQLDSGMILPGSSFEFTFTEPGEYSYHSEPHPWLRGKVIVVESFS